MLELAVIKLLQIVIITASLMFKKEACEVYKSLKSDF